MPLKDRFSVEKSSLQVERGSLIKASSPNFPIAGPAY